MTGRGAGSAQPADATRAQAADAALFDAIVGPPGTVQRRAIAKAITLIESTRDDHRARAEALLGRLLARQTASLRIGISGVPGVGKSTFIEALGLHLVDAGHRVAVLAVDPSSALSGGSILGDKTRMERLSVHAHAFVRPSPSSGTLGGVTERTRETIGIVEGAGYDVVIVETVGVGQSEAAVASMTDAFVLLQLPNAGDDLQAIKKGVLELADLVVVNKADIDPQAAARACGQLALALELGARRGAAGATGGLAWRPLALQMSALAAADVAAFWAELERFRSVQTASGAFDARRREQALAWLDERIASELRAAFERHPAVRAALPTLAAAIGRGEATVPDAVRRLLRAAGIDGGAAACSE
ncbi:methylmalonyl Co-A mutase-associated GTPase MeaB [Piscinibacter koreensis]|uniref:Methylmalonyl Co-A mutase-associated GTPase MeaB n=1 Tax=Piscinibacter koreensis TaxID=2742824 RepID=A0A7Y6NRU6_9BURK|nr:methylmalonyl Co-A mutase-associated GTPase MeaB [Schlegelella koreensis]NUZ08176.1 methylmalonyl Co-A mutase-associated GTPase MeaB [Schlegelella koreensis]